MNDACKKLLAGMVVCAVAGRRERMFALYEKFQKENRLHVPIREILEWKKERIA